MTAKPRKRAPGGGRKPAPKEKVKNRTFYARLDSKTDEMLTAEAALRGKDRSEVAREALIAGLNKAKEGRIPDATRALLFEIGKLADGVSVSSPDGRRFMWNEDAFAFQAFQCALTFFMSKLESELRLGDAEVKTSALQKYITERPDEIDEIWLKILASPERLGERAYERIWLDLITYEPTGIAMAKEVFNPDDKMAGKWSEYTYALDQVRSSLGLKRRES